MTILFFLGVLIVCTLWLPVVRRYFKADPAADSEPPAGPGKGAPAQAPRHFLTSIHRLQVLEGEVDRLASDVEVLIQRRFDVLRALLLVLGHSQAWEAGVIDRIATARNPGQMAQVVQENYPQLRSVVDFPHLQQQLLEIETEITRARKAYNWAVERFNAQMNRFPGRLIAYLLRIRPRPYFTADPSASSDVSAANHPFTPRRDLSWPRPCMLLNRGPCSAELESGSS